MKPRPSQEQGIEFLVRGGNILFWDMRMGKTATVIWACQRLGYKAILVLAPNSALGSWINELEALGEEGVVVLEGTREKRKKRLNSAGKWFLLNHRGYVSVPEIGVMKWDCVVLDESASCIRYPRTKVTKWMLARFKESRKIILAGRPDPQDRLLDYWPQMAFALGGMWMGCRNYWAFRRRYFYEYFMHEWRPKRGAKEAILERVSKDAFVLRREHVDLEVEKVIEPRYLDMPPSVSRIYRKAEKEFILELESGEEKKTQWVLTKYQWLRQLASGFLDGKRFWAGGLDELKALINGELNDEPVVIWCAYNQEVYDLQTSLGERVHWITGNVPTEERRAKVADFQAGRMRIIVCQVRCAETGTDLAKADTAIYYSPPFSVLTWSQSQDRVLGDLTKSGVLIVPLITRETIHEDIWGALQEKDENSKKFLDEVHRRMMARQKKGKVLCQ